MEHNLEAGTLLGAWSSESGRSNDRPFSDSKEGLLCFDDKMCRVEGEEAWLGEGLGDQTAREEGGCEVKK